VTGLRQQSFILTGTLASKLASIVCYAASLSRGEPSSPEMAMLKKLSGDREVAEWLASLGPRIRVKHRPRVR